MAPRCCCTPRTTGQRRAPNGCTVQRRLRTLRRRRTRPGATISSLRSRAHTRRRTPLSSAASSTAPHRARTLSRRPRRGSRSCLLQTRATARRPLPPWLPPLLLPHAQADLAACPRLRSRLPTRLRSKAKTSISQGSVQPATTCVSLCLCVCFDFVIFSIFNRNANSARRATATTARRCSRPLRA